MSRFSVYLKNLVEESGVPHATLARAAGLNRPNLQNILSGSRKPSRKDVDNLLPHLRASAAQQAELMELLEGELLGPDVVERRACVRLMLERLYQDCAEGERILRIAKPQRLRLPQDVMIAVREYVGTHFVLPLENSGEYCNVQIGEATITDAFLDLITHAAESDAVCPRDVTLEKIRSAMQSI